MIMFAGLGSVGQIEGQVGLFCLSPGRRACDKRTASGWLCSPQPLLL